jgi:hypothetical protein
MSISISILTSFSKLYPKEGEGQRLSTKCRSQGKRCLKDRKEDLATFSIFSFAFHPIFDLRKLVTLSATNTPKHTFALDQINSPIVKKSYPFFSSISKTFLYITFHEFIRLDSKR